MSEREKLDILAERERKKAERAAKKAAGAKRTGTEVKGRSSSAAVASGSELELEKKNKGDMPDQKKATEDALLARFLQLPVEERFRNYAACKILELGSAAGSTDLKTCQLSLSEEEKEEGDTTTCGDESDSSSRSSIQVLTRAKNVRVGQKVPVALIGANLISGSAVSELQVGGLLSQGSLCDSYLLGWKGKPGAPPAGQAVILPAEYPLGAMPPEEPVVGAEGNTDAADEEGKSEPEPPTPLTHFQHVLDKRRANPRQDKLKKDPVTKMFTPPFTPFFGVTCVMHLSKSSLENFAKPLYALLAKDIRVTSALALLPPESYHVTLRGLEPCLKDLEGKKSSVVAEGLATFKAAQDQLNQLFLAKSPTAAKEGTLHGDVFTMRISELRTKSFGMECDGGSTGKEFESVLRLGEQILVQNLLLPAASKSKSTSSHANEETKSMRQARELQHWHMTLGYLIAKDQTLLDAMWTGIKEAVAAVAAASKDPHFPSSPANAFCNLPLQFVAPQICYYHSMEHFEPLFE